MITILQEITDWDQVNGIYHVNDHTQLVAYQAPGAELKQFKSPMKRFSKARRKFEVIGTYEEANEAGERFEFTGSKGNAYVVIVLDGKTRCNCPGFTYRGNCKHVNEVIANGPGGQAPAWQ